MDLYTKLSKNFEDVVSLFQSRMGDYDLQLKHATASPRHDLSSLARDYNDFKSFIWKTLKLLKCQMELLAHGLDRHEMNSRRKVLLFHGISETPGEIVIDKISTVITAQMNLPQLGSTDIVVCHRLGTKSDKTRPILVRFLSYNSRNIVWNAKTALKGSGIIISEFLTKLRHDVFAAARNHFGTTNSWTVEGKVVVILADKTRRKVETMSELQAIISGVNKGTKVIYDATKRPHKKAPVGSQLAAGGSDASSKSRTRRQPSGK